MSQQSDTPDGRRVQDTIRRLVLREETEAIPGGDAAAGSGVQAGAFLSPAGWGVMGAGSAVPVAAGEEPPAGLAGGGATASDTFGGDMTTSDGPDGPAGASGALRLTPDQRVRAMDAEAGGPMSLAPFALGQAVAASPEAGEASDTVRATSEENAETPRRTAADSDLLADDRRLARLEALLGHGPAPAFAAPRRDEGPGSESAGVVAAQGTTEAGPQGDDPAGADADGFAFSSEIEESDLRALVGSAVRDALLGSAGDAFRETLRQVVREELDKALERQGRDG